MKQKMDYLTYIVAGIRNKPGRNIATIFCFAFIAANIFSGQYLSAGASGSVDQGISRMGADLVVVPTQYILLFRGSSTGNTMAIIRVEPSTTRLNTSDMDTIRTVQGIAGMSPQLYVSTLSLPDLSVSPVDIFGIDPDTDFTIRPWLQSPLRHPFSPGEVIVGNGIPGPVSSQITIAGNSYTIAGRLDPTRSAIDRTIFLKMDDAYALAAKDGIVPASDPRIYPGDINAVLIRLEPEPAWFVQGTVKLQFKITYVEFVQDVIRNQFKATYATVIGRHSSLDPVAEEVAGVPDLLRIISGVVVVAAFPLIALIAAMVTHERQREIGLLRSMGARRKLIAFLVIAESLFLAVAGGVAGVTASIVIFTVLNLTGILNSALQVSFRYPTLADTGVIAGIALLVVVAIGSLASLYPAYQSSRMNPYDAIRWEGQYRNNG
jgi:putative ABC transport system permease protein